MIRPPPRPTRTYTLFPDTTRFRSQPRPFGAAARFDQRAALGRTCRRPRQLAAEDLGRQAVAARAPPEARTRQKGAARRLSHIGHGQRTAGATPVVVISGPVRTSSAGCAEAR